MMVHSSVASLAASVFIVSLIQVTSGNKTVPCDKSSCTDNKVCDISTGKCIENPCNLVDCSPGEECHLQYVQCFTFPCPPIAECRPSQPCDETSCLAHQVCDISTGKCKENPCNYRKCVAGEECRVQYVQCVKAPCPPIAECHKSCAAVTCPDGEMCEDGQCVLDSRCATVLCLEGTYCYNGSCFKDVPCIEGQCGPAEKCYMGSEPCNKHPCPTKVICRPDKCAVVRCAGGTKCVDGACIPKDD